MFFIFQVVEVKLHFEVYEKRLKALNLQKASAKGMSHLLYTILQTFSLVFIWLGLKLHHANLF